MMLVTTTDVMVTVENPATIIFGSTYTSIASRSSGVSPALVTSLARRNASAIVGAAGLISTVAALLLTSWLVEGLRIAGGVGSWIYASVVVWLVTMVAALLLPMLFRRDAEARGRRAAA